MPLERPPEVLLLMPNHYELSERLKRHNKFLNEFSAKYHLRSAPTDLDFCPVRTTLMILRVLRLAARSLPLFRLRLHNFIDKTHTIVRWFRGWLQKREHAIQQICENWIKSEGSHRQSVRSQLYKDCRIRPDRARSSVRHLVKFYSSEDEKYVATKGVYWRKRKDYRKKVRIWFAAYRGIRTEIEALEKHHAAIPMTSRIVLGSQQQLCALRSRLYTVAAARPRFVFSVHTTSIEELAAEFSNPSSLFMRSFRERLGSSPPCSSRTLVSSLELSSPVLLASSASSEISVIGDAGRGEDDRLETRSESVVSSRSPSLAILANLPTIKTLALQGLAHPGSFAASPKRHHRESVNQPISLQRQSSSTLEAPSSQSIPFPQRAPSPLTFGRSHKKGSLSPSFSRTRSSLSSTLSITSTTTTSPSLPPVRNPSPPPSALRLAPRSPTQTLSPNTGGDLVRRSLSSWSGCSSQCSSSNLSHTLTSLAEDLDKDGDGNIGRDDEDDKSVAQHEAQKGHEDWLVEGIDESMASIVTQSDLCDVNSSPNFQSSSRSASTAAHTFLSPASIPKNSNPRATRPSPFTPTSARHHHRLVASASTASTAGCSPSSSSSSVGGPSPRSPLLLASNATVSVVDSKRGRSRPFRLSSLLPNFRS